MIRRHSFRELAGADLGGAIHVLLFLVLALIVFTGLMTDLAGFQRSRSLSCFSSQSGSESDGPRVRLQATSEFNQRFLLEELEWQRRLDVDAEIYIVPANNAFAVPNGPVLLGQELADRYVSRGDLAFAFQALGYITAHEYGHQFQFRMTKGQLAGGPETELQADAIAGYWIGMRLREQVGQGLPREEAEAVKKMDIKAAFEIGDYLFGDPSHHGTPDQRHAAVRAGIESGYGYRLGGDFRARKAAEQLFDETRAIVAGLKTNRTARR